MGRFGNVGAINNRAVAPPLPGAAAAAAARRGAVPRPRLANGAAAARRLTPGQRRRALPVRYRPTPRQIMPQSRRYRPEMATAPAIRAVSNPRCDNLLPGAAPLNHARPPFVWRQFVCRRSLMTPSCDTFFVERLSADNLVLPFHRFLKLSLIIYHVLPIFLLSSIIFLIFTGAFSLAVNSHLA